jgi:phosphatidylserine synthase
VRIAFCIAPSVVCYFFLHSRTSVAVVVVVVVVVVVMALRWIDRLVTGAAPIGSRIGHSAVATGWRSPDGMLLC